MFIEVLAAWTEAKKGSSGMDAKRVQEWLTLHRLAVRIDSDYGPATEAAVKKFQRKQGLAESGAVDAATAAALEKPLHAAGADIAAGGRSLGDLVVAYASQHVAQEPREVGGQNRGPWVRLYMFGKEGELEPWCAGFASYSMRQACQTLGIETPIRPSSSCDRLAESAKQAGRFLREPPRAERVAKVKPGSLFLKRKTDTDWVHTGIVERVFEDHIETLEGNTNDDGSREGYEACRLHRGWTSVDFVLL